MERRPTFIVRLKNHQGNAMATTAVLSEDTATIIQDEGSRFEWAAVVAGAIIGTAMTFFLVSVGTGLGLSLASVHGATASGTKTFVTAGAVYFLAANAFGFAIGGYVVGRMMKGEFYDSEKEHFRTDVHALAVWGIGVVFGVGLLALTAGPSISASATSNVAATPVNYWVDKLFRPVASQDTATRQAGLSASSPPAISVANNRTLADIKSEAARLLTASQANKAAKDDKDRLDSLVSQTVGMAPEVASARVTSVENDMAARAKEAAEAARKAASYVGIWTALALLFSAIVCVVSALYARHPNETAIARR